MHQLTRRLFSSSRIIRPCLSTRTFTYSAFTLSSRPDKPNPFIEQPSPPQLPKEEQEIFERLQRQSTGAFQTSHLSKEGGSSSSNGPSTTVRIESEEDLEHPQLRRGEKPLFEGDTNPATGEVGGPKTDPLKYGDYAFNGRVTDF